MTAVISACIKKMKIGEFLCNHFNIEGERKMQHFWHMMLYYLKNGKRTTKTHIHTKKIVQ